MRKFFTRSIFVILGIFGIFLSAAVLTVFLLSESRAFNDVSALIYRPSFPDRVKIQSQDRREIEVELSGRSSTHVEFRRLSDSSLFVYPIRFLSKRSQEKILRYPDTGLRDSSTLLETGQISLEEAHIQEARKEFENLSRKIELLKREARMLGGSQKQAIRVDIQNLREKRDSLELSIAKRRPEFNEPNWLDQMKYSASGAFDELSAFHPSKDE